MEQFFADLDRLVGEDLADVFSEEEEIVEEEVGVARKEYRVFRRAKVADFTDADFHIYFRMTKVSFWRFLQLVRHDIGECDERR